MRELAAAVRALPELFEATSAAIEAPTNDGHRFRFGFLLRLLEATLDIAQYTGTEPLRELLKSGGRPPAADWPAIDEAYNREVDLVGLPHKLGVPGWRTQADVIRWVEERLGKDEPGKTALKDNVRGMMERAEKRVKMGFPA